MSIFTRRGRSYLFLAASVSIGLATPIAVGSVFLYRSKASSASAYPVITPHPKTAKIAVKLSTEESILEKSLRVRDTIKRGDYANAGKITTDVLKESTLQNWRYYPFSDFIGGIPDGSDPTFATHLNEWVARSNKNDAIPLLIRAQYYYEIGWHKRGSHFARNTQAAAMTFFEQYMKNAFIDDDAAIHLNEGNPYGFYLKLRILHGFGVSQTMKSAFEQAITKYSDYYPLYQIVLSTLEPKWGGTVDAMYAFADHYAGNAPRYSPPKLLYLDLYLDLLDTASINCARYRHDNDKNRQCVEYAMGKIMRPDLKGHMTEALQLYDHSDRYQFDTAIANILFKALAMPGGDLYSGAFLQLAASLMHSNTQLLEDKPSHNDYIIDEAVAGSWYKKGFYNNAENKYKEALKDINFSPFPGKGERNLALVAVYEDLAGLYNHIGQYRDGIDYAKMAMMIDDATGSEIFLCYGYSMLKQYDKAISACTKAFDRGDDLQARYWRGMAYRALDRMDVALQDFKAVADSENDFRTVAALEMSVIYARRKQIQQSLAVLNKYTYLYDPNMQSKENIAASYNNRCYDYMQLGELKKALDDCTTSLKYSSLPDAYRKEQELIKRLHEKGS